MSLGFRIDGFELATVDRDDATVQEIKTAAKSNELLAYLTDGRTVVAAKVGDGLEVGRQAARELYQLQVPPALALKAARRLHQVEITIDINLEHRCWMVARTPCSSGMTPPKPSTPGSSASTKAPTTRTELSLPT